MNTMIISQSITNGKGKQRSRRNRSSGRHSPLELSSSSSSSCATGESRRYVVTLLAVAAVAAGGIPQVTAASSSPFSGSFPGTRKSKEDWWTQPHTLPSSDPHGSPAGTSASLQSTDENDDDDDESSSDWEGPDDDVSGEQGEEAMMASASSKKDLLKEATEGGISKGITSLDAKADPSTKDGKKQTNVASKASSSSSKPLQTLEKLQQMLDETDYLTTSSRRGNPMQEFTSGSSDQVDASTMATAAAITTTSSNSNSNSSDDEYDAIVGNGITEDDGAVDQGGELPLDPPLPSSLWTSQDRSKYKRQQRNAAAAVARASSAATTSISQPQASPMGTPPVPPERMYEYSYPPPAVRTGTASSGPSTLDLKNTLPRKKSSTSITATTSKSVSPPYEASLTSDVEDPSDTDDGLGYTLPNLPVYLSDDEGDSATDGGGWGSAAAGGAAAEEVVRAATTAQPLYSSSNPSISTGTVTGPDVIHHHHHQQQQQVPPAGMYFPYPTPIQPQHWYYGSTTNDGPPPATTGTSSPPPQSYGYYPPPPPPLMSPEQLHQYYLQQQQQHQQQQAWATPPGPGPYFYPRPYVPRLEGTVGRSSSFSTRRRVPATTRTMPSTTFQHYPAASQPPAFATTTTARMMEPVASETEKWRPSQNFRLTVDSIVKLATCLILAAVVCYAAVSPHNLPYLEYNQRFYQNLRLAGLTTLAPLVVAALVVDPKQEENCLSGLIHAFYVAFTYGYVITFGLQVLAATVTRLAIFAWWEPRVFDMTPQVPLLVIPWVLREQKYLVKPITLIAQDLVTSAVVCPLVEEWIKLLILHWTVPLAKNFEWVSKPSRKNPRKRKRVAEPIVPAMPPLSSSYSLGEDDAMSGLQRNGQVINVNQYVSGMLAVSLGLKMADAIRRVCMYTKAGDQNKGFYALFRGIFPIQELCGTVTALGLARRDVLGQKMPLWKLLLPSAIIHGMANFRGMKPIFKWNSATPWSEMQLSPNFMANGASLTELAGKAFPKIMWLIILMRVTGYCVKNYFMINRQAVKRTTTYAGKHAAFSAELAAAEMLKSTKNSKDSKKEKL